MRFTPSREMKIDVLKKQENLISSKECIARACKRKRDRLRYLERDGSDRFRHAQEV